MNYFGLFFSFTIPGIVVGMMIMASWFKVWARSERRRRK